MKALIAIAIALVTILDVAAATITAASTSLADVTSAVAVAAATGDIIVLPAGASTWSGTITTSKCFTLQGAGTNSTILTRVNGLFLRFQPTVDNALIRVTGITFSNSVGATASSIEINGKNASGVGPLVRQFRIDRCRFLNGTRAVQLYGGVYGLIDQNTYGNCNIAVGPIGNDNWGWNSEPVTVGTTNSLYIENNDFVINNSAPSEPNQAIYHQGGARSVTRYNRFDSSTYTLGNGIWFDSHGNFPNGGTSYASTNQTRGQPILEVYNNSFRSHHTYLMLDLRGGSALVANNSFTYLTGSAPDAILLTEEEGWATATFNPLRTVWPAMDQVTNTFLWNNTLNSAPISALTFNHVSDLTFIQEGRDYWMQQPSASNGNPAGIYNGYTPLVYPHPMATAQDNPPSPTPSPGTGKAALLLIFYPDGRITCTNGIVILPTSIISGSVGQIAVAGLPEVSNALVKIFK